MLHRFITATLTLSLLGTAHAAELTVITHNSFDLDKKLIARFEQQTGAQVRFVKGGDAGEMLNKLILTKNAPIADVVYGIDNTMLGKARAAGILEPYKSPALGSVPAQYRLADDGLLNTVDYGFVALNYDKAYFEKNNVPLPKTLDDLTKPQYRNMLVVQNPTTSSPGLAFMLATVKHLGPQKAWAWWTAMKANGMRVTRGWSDAYYKDFSRNGGKYPIVVSYASSPAAEVFYSEKQLDASPTANLLLPGSVFLQLEGVGVLKGTKQRELSRKFVDFMLSPEVQADFPTRMWVYPARSGVKLDPVFKFAVTPQDTVAFTPAEIRLNAPIWTERWTRTVLRGQ